MQKKSAAISDTKTYIDIRKHSRSPTDTWAAWTNRGHRDFEPLDYPLPLWYNGNCVGGGHKLRTAKGENLI